MPRTKSGGRRSRSAAAAPRERPRGPPRRVDAERQPLHPRSRARHRRSQSPVPALGVPTTDERKDGSHSREDPDAHCLPQGVPKIDYVSYPWEARRDADVRRHDVRDIHFLAADVHGRPHGGPQAKPAWMGTRPGIGKAIARRRDHGLQRQALARPDRPPDDGSPARDRTFHAHALRPYAHRRDRGRPGRVHGAGGPLRRSCIFGRPGSRSSSSAKRQPGHGEPSGRRGVGRVSNVEAARRKGYLKSAARSCKRIRCAL